MAAETDNKKNENNINKNINAVISGDGKNGGAPSASAETSTPLSAAPAATSIPPTSSAALPRTEAAVGAYYNPDFNTDPSGSWTGRPETGAAAATAAAAAVKGGKICVHLKDSHSRPTQDADDL